MFIRSFQNHLARHSERGEKTRQTEEEVGRQHQGMDRPEFAKSRRAVENRVVRTKPSARHSERGKKTRQTEKEAVRQHQEMDRPGARQVLEGNGEQSKMEETGCEVICGAPTTPAVMGLVKVQVKSSKQSGETGSKPGPMVLI